VKQHRDQFDRYEPDPSIWLRINPASTNPASTNPANNLVKRQPRPMRWLRVAAAVAMIFAGSTAGLYFLTGEKGERDPYRSELYQEMTDTEQYYNRMVSDRFEELKPFLTSNPAASEMLSSDMEELDQAYKELKEDLKDNASNPEVVEAMILNYRVKLEILEDLLNQLKEKENQNAKKDESYSL
jgi:hypothetical protein